MSDGSAAMGECKTKQLKNPVNRSGVRCASLFVCLFACVCSVLAAAGCSDASSGDGFSGEWEPYYDTGGTSGASGDTGGGSSQDTSLPPEEELALQTPEAARDFVFVASGTLDMVARIEARSLEIENVPVGDDPIEVRTRPTINTAVVLNRGSADVSVLHAVVDGPTTEARLGVEPGLNRLEISPAGDFAVAYFDASRAKPTDPLGSLQAVSLIRTGTDQEIAVNLAVSFNVRSVQFDAASTRAFMITDDFLHIVDMNAVIEDPTTHDPGQRIALSEDPTQTAEDREVHVTEDGNFAMVRSLSAAQIDIIELATGNRRVVTLSGPASDLDLLPEGRGAVAVVRDQAELVLLSLPLAFTSENAGVQTISAAQNDLTVGQALLSDDGTRAVVFSTADESARIGLLTIETATLDVWRLGSGKSVRGAVLSPDGGWVMVKHRPQTGADPVLASEGFSIIKLPDPNDDASGFYDKLFQTDAEIGPGLFTQNVDDTGHLLVLITDAAQMLDVQLSTMHDRQELLGSPPMVLGSMPLAERVYISQRHDLGRISFFDLPTGQLQTVTGFELNSRIR